MADPVKTDPAPVNFSKLPLIGVILTTPSPFGAKDAKRFYRKGTAGELLARGGLSASGADAVANDIQWLAYGLSVGITGELVGGKRTPFTIAVVLGAGDRVVFGDAPAVAVEKPKAA